MKCGYTPKWVHPKKMITHFSEIFKEVDIKKTSLRNLLFVIRNALMEASGKHSSPLFLFATAPYPSSGWFMKMKRSET